MTHVLHIDASMRREGSATRRLSAAVVDHLRPARIARRDLADGIDLIDAAWIGANFTDPAERTDAQRAALATSDALVAELKAADILVIGLPIYNFGVPAAFKAWIDQIARARETFRYTDAGPVGLLTGKRAILVVASGGTEVGSALDFATPYVRHALGFVGIDHVTIIAADRLMGDDANRRLAEALAEVRDLAA